MIEQDWGLPSVPVTNLPLREGDDPHGHVFDPLPTGVMIDAFPRTGSITNVCAGTCNPD